MGAKSKIEWTDATWNALYGCSRVSEGCRNCYAERHIHRFAGPGQRHEGLTVIRGGRPGWTGEIQLRPDRLEIPLRWQGSKRVFVNSLSDLFHENVPFEFIAASFGVMAVAKRHQFQLLTKRPERAAEFFEWLSKDLHHKINDAVQEMVPRLADVAVFPTQKHGMVPDVPWPLSNVWLGVSVEDQKTAEERIPILMECPAAVRWISAEPLLGPIDLDKVPGADQLQWVVVGGESGPSARPMDPAWVEMVCEWCKDNGVPKNFKQFGLLENNPNSNDPTAKENGGSAKGGRMMNGSTWDQEPEVVSSLP